MAAKEDYGTGQKEEQRKPQGEREEEDEAHSRTQGRIAQDRSQDCSQGRRETDGEEEDRTQREAPGKQRKEEHRQRQEEHRQPQVIRGTSRSGGSSTGGGRAGLRQRDGRGHRGNGIAQY